MSPPFIRGPKDSSGHTPYLLSVATKENPMSEVTQSETSTEKPQEPVLVPPAWGGQALRIAGMVGVGLSMVATVVIPAPWGVLVAIVGVTVATLAGFAAKPPNFTGGSPVVQGAALTVATTVFTGAAKVYESLPPSWQPVVWGVLAVLGVLTGKALPALGSKPPTV
jgi:hypothetical protein